MLFNLSWRTKFVESTLCHAGKDVDHRVYTIFLVSLCKADDLNAKGQECPVKESVHQKHLSWKHRRHNVKTQHKLTLSIDGGSQALFGHFSPLILTQLNVLLLENSQSVVPNEMQSNSFDQSEGFPFLPVLLLFLEFKTRSKWSHIHSDITIAQGLNSNRLDNNWFA